MGSFFAGVKSGTLAGTLYLGGLALFNVGTLYSMKSQVLDAIASSYPTVCAVGPSVNGTSVDDCFASVLAVYVPFVAFIGFFVALFFAALFGRYYEKFPGSASLVKGIWPAALVGSSLYLLGLTGFYFGEAAQPWEISFLVGWSLVFGLVLAKLYSRYTRTVSFGIDDEGGGRVTVGGRDMTGKSATFAHRSIHELKAEPAEGASFVGWTATGGVKVEDASAYQTELEVEGGGSVTARTVRRK